MASERNIIRKVALGLAAALLAVAVIHVLNRAGIYVAWAQIMAAALVGAVAGVAEKRRNKIVLGVVLGCAGWICGELFSRLLFHSVATWMFVGSFIGLTAGILEKSPKSMIGGLFLGVMGGLMGVAAGLSTIIVDSMRDFDMQALSILGAGVGISFFLGLKRPKNGDTVVASDNEREKPDSPGEKHGVS
jgi:hypothetical protein